MDEFSSPYSGPNIEKLKFSRKFKKQWNNGPRRVTVKRDIERHRAMEYRQARLDKIAHVYASCGSSMRFLFCSLRVLPVVVCPQPEMGAGGGGPAATASKGKTPGARATGAAVS